MVDDMVVWGASPMVCLRAIAIVRRRVVSCLTNHDRDEVANVQYLCVAFVVDGCLARYSVQESDCVVDAYDRCCEVLMPLQFRHSIVLFL